MKKLTKFIPMRTRNFLLCVILIGFSLKAFAQKTDALNLLVNVPVKIANQKSSCLNP